MATKRIRRRLRELENALRAAVVEVQWMADVWNAADRVAGQHGEVPYDPFASPDLPPLAAASVQPAEGGPVHSAGE